MTSATVHVRIKKKLLIEKLSRSGRKNNGRSGAEKCFMNEQSDGLVSEAYESGCKFLWAILYDCKGVLLPQKNYDLIILAIGTDCFRL